MLNYQRPGTPLTTTSDGTDLVTTAPAPTTVRAPTVRFCKIVAADPMGAHRAKLLEEAEQAALIAPSTLEMKGLMR